MTVVGVPGIGKSRLVGELYARVDADPDLINWRQGRSHPYGEGVAFSALADMVKAEAGILDSDSAEAAEEKLLGSLEALPLEERERDWIEQSPRPLVGIGGEARGGDRRVESFAAWRRYLEARAELRPHVLIFEDLHWADDDLLDFVDELADWIEGVPVLVLCTARPELLERRPGWGGGKRNALTISLAPLSEEDTARLIGQLLERPLLPADEQAELLARIGGNPLFAEQFVRVAAEHGANELPRRCTGSSPRASTRSRRARRLFCRTQPSSGACSGAAPSAQEQSSTRSSSSSCARNSSVASAGAWSPARRSSPSHTR